MDIRKICLTCCGFLVFAGFSSTVYCNPLDIFKNGSVSTEKYDDQFLVMDYDDLKLVIKDFKVVCVVNPDELTAQFNFGLKKEAKIKFKDGVQAEKWMKSVFTGYECLTENGIQECE